MYVSGEKGKTFVARGVTGSAPLIQGSSTFEAIIDSFQRVKVTEDLYVSNYTDPGNIDQIGPGRITDVGISHIVTKTTPYGESRNYTITWTATGGDKNIGQAAAYELKISDDMDTLLQSFENAHTLEMINETILPKNSGETENLKIVIDAEASYTETAFFAMRAVDDAGNAGPVSNIILIVVANGYRAAVEKGPTITFAISPKTDNVEPSASNSSDLLAIILGASVGVGLFLAFIVFAIVWYLLDRRKPKGMVV